MKRLILLITIIVGFVTAAQAQFFDEVNFKGAIGDKDWTKGWTNFKCMSQDYPLASVELTGVISQNTILYKRNVYLLKENVYVTNRATLFIEPGTIIRGDFETKGTLIITKGAKIRALGTELEPIVFTSNKTVGQRHMGDWGGIIILGNARVNMKGGQALMEGDLDPKMGMYGGKDDDDNSGILKYVRIEFPGNKISRVNEINGISLCGVGRKTQMEYVQVSYSFDDSFEFYGGSICSKYIVSYKCTDDDFDMNYGYSGVLQFGIALRHPGIKDYSGSKGIESDSYSSDNNLADNGCFPTTSVVSNFTIISPEKSSGAKMKQGIYIGNNSGTSVHNTVVIGFENGLWVKGEDSEDKLITDQLEFKNNVILGSDRPINGTSSSVDYNSWFINPEFSNMFVKSMAEAVLKDPYNQNNPNFMPTPSAALLKGAGFTGLNKGYRDKTFLEETTYSGAFYKIDWTEGWKNYTPKTTSYKEPNNPVSGSITTHTAWTKDKVYLLKGIVTVKTGASLTIEAGTLIRCDNATKAALLIEKGAKLKAFGTQQEPIIFTSSKVAGARKEGDWGGIIVIGKDKVNTVSHVGNYRNLSIPLAYGGTVTNDSSGTLKYVRIEFAGALYSLEKVSGLVMAGVGGMDLDFVQVSYAAGNSFELLGGRANGKHLISYRCMDDDFATAYGYSGHVQYAFGIRDPLLAEINKANGIEAINRDDEDLNYITTQPVFANVTIVGPQQVSSSQINRNFNAAVHLSKNTTLSIYNSVFIGFPKGVVMEGNKVEFNAASQQIVFKHNIIAGCAEPLLTDNNTGTWNIKNWYNNPLYRNKVLNESADAKLASAFVLEKPNLLPNADSPCVNYVSTLTRK
jgi:hypothetical protein